MHGVGRLGWSYAFLYLFVLFFVYVFVFGLFVPRVMYIPRA